MNHPEDKQFTLQRFMRVLDLVTYPSFSFVVSAREAGFYLQIECKGTCNVTGEPLAWKSRKWMLSAHMTDGEIVQTAFKAVLTALEHEARENFLYRGVSVFDPHYDLDALVRLRRDPSSIKERS